MAAYYNEIDPKAAAWLRELIKAGHVADGEVDERSIVDVRPDELRGFTQCHFFAGIGGWSYALRLAGWPDDRPVWTGSCPCQPFSAAGRREGVADERHLWPHWHHLISVCRPSVVFGEQVASKDGLGWLDLVCADMEGSGYAVGAADLCAAGVGAPHIRQRLWFVGLADAVLAGRAEGRAVAGDGSSASGSINGGLADAAPELDDRTGDRGTRWGGEHSDGSGAGGLADADGGHTGEERQQRGGQYRQQPEDGGVGGLADTCPDGSQGRVRGGSDSGRAVVDGSFGLGGADRGPRPTDGHWRDADWLFCRDAKWRPVEPGTFPLAHGVSARVGRLRGYGNAIVPQAAATFISAVIEGAN